MRNPSQAATTAARRRRAGRSRQSLRIDLVAEAATMPPPPRSLRRNDPLSLDPQPLNPQPHHVAFPQKHRLWLDAGANTRRRACGDHVARMQRDEVADIADQLPHPKDHRLGGTVLEAFAVHLGPQRQVLRIGYLVLRHHPWAGWTERFTALTLVPGATTLDL